MTIFNTEQFCKGCGYEVSVEERIMVRRVDRHGDFLDEVTACDEECEKRIVELNEYDNEHEPVPCEEGP